MGRDPVIEALEAKLRRAALVLAWEQVWRLGWPLPAWVLLFVAVALLDLLPRLSSFWHAAALAGFAAGLLALLARLRHFRWPGRAQQQRRLEADNGLAHRPLSQLDDQPAAVADDAIGRGLWRTERQRILTRLSALRLGWPAPGLPRFDPYGLRFVPLLLLAIAIAAGRHDPAERLARALDPGLDAGLPPPLLQLWITPPPYTGLSPRLLTLAPVSEPILVPAGSTLLAELQGPVNDARLLVDDQAQPFVRLDGQSQKLETTLTGGRSLAVKAGWHRLASWPITVVADQPPVISWQAPPTSQADARLALSLSAEDDYGVEKVGLILSRQGQPDRSSEILLPGGGQRQLRLTPLLDLSAHPWSGLPVSLRPFAEDGASQRGLGETISLVLPERQFRHPVARALASLRRRLAQDPRQAAAIAEAIADIAAEPERFGGDLQVFLQLTTARSRLGIDGSDAAIASVLDMLWAAMIRIEDGDLPDARAAVDQASQALAEALRQGATDAEITRLTAQLNQAMQRLLDSLASRAGPPPPGGAADDDRSMTAEQLQAMLRQTSDLAHAGARQAAQQSLQALQDLLDRLSPQGGNDAQAQQLRQGAKTLERLSQQQRALLDRSFRRDQAAEGDEDGAPQGKAGGGKDADKAAAAADSKAEDGLQQQLRQLQQSLPDGQAGPALEQALRHMGQASEALRDNQGAPATLAEGQALDQLQQAARQIGEAAAQAAAGGSSGGGRDPLGRALSEGQGVDSDGVKIPSHGDVGKSREILDDLRRRAADLDRPADERAYLRRLLEKLY